MNSKKRNLLDLFIIITYFISAIQFLIPVFNNNYIYFFIFQLLFMILSFKLKKQIIRKLFFLILIIFLSYLNIKINHGGLGSVVIYVGFFISIWWVENINFDSQISKIITFIFAMLGIYYSVYSNSITYNYTINGTGMNPNLCAQIILYCLLLVNIFVTRNNLTKFIIPLVNIIMLVGIYFTDCRSVLISSLLFFIFILVKKIMNLRHYKYIFITFLVLCVMVPYIYVFMSKHNINFTLFFSTKNFYTGREVIWLNIFNVMSEFKNLFFGIGSKHYFAQRYINVIDAHNVFLSSVCNYGIVLTILLFFTILNTIFKSSEDDFKNNYLSFIGILVVLFCGIFENIFLWEKSVLFFVTILGTIRCNWRNKNEIVSE